ncbi:hypothetical protein JCM9152_3416 [Halalkalibacter hemicellulosilyticusJCM 9152]|uniref:Uncharacterized protein n=1 Tax=Halalkalibacter hemicellulosilyticusJCM 9152 TaxID=1236971 RepID=W4QIM0_9BACI|nr:hypothetical protein JCM9152_3416 [Halalkalibacter hemicellulosilyticusJCM 9152]
MLFSPQGVAIGSIAIFFAFLNRLYKKNFLAAFSFHHLKKTLTDMVTPSSISVLQLTGRTVIP